MVSKKTPSQSSSEFLFDQLYPQFSHLASILSAGITVADSSAEEKRRMITAESPFDVAQDRLRAQSKRF
jgi:hypothetical protein